MKPRPIDVVIGVLLVAGFALRLHDFSFPGHMTFDEHHFVENARNYLSGKHDWNDHPPLGKLFIALSIHVFGDNSVGWRAPALFFGALTLILTALAVRRLAGDWRTGWLAAALLAADGFFISYSRLGLLDGDLVACAAAALLVATLRPTWKTAALAGVVTGVACSIKFSGVALFPLFLTAFVTAPGVTPRRKAALFTGLAVVAVGLYFALYALGLRLTNNPISVVEDTRRLLAHHATLTGMTNPLTSSWPTWALPTRPLMMGAFHVDGGVRALSSLGNLAIWWPAVVLGLGLAVTVVWRGVGNVLARDGEGFVSTNGRAVVLLGSGALSFIGPWLMSRRDSYIYHFLPAYFFLVVLLGLFVGWLHKTRNTAALAYLLMVLLVFSFYAPVWSFFVISYDAFDARFFLEGWR